MAFIQMQMTSIFTSAIFAKGSNLELQSHRREMMIREKMITDWAIVDPVLLVDFQGFGSSKFRLNEFPSSEVGGFFVKFFV